MQGLCERDVESSAVPAEVAQMVERAPEKGEAVGSLPTLGTTLKDSMQFSLESFFISVLVGQTVGTGSK